MDNNNTFIFLNFRSLEAQLKKFKTEREHIVEETKRTMRNKHSYSPGQFRDTLQNLTTRLHILECERKNHIVEIERLRTEKVEQDKSLATSERRSAKLKKKLNESSATVEDQAIEIQRVEERICSAHYEKETLQQKYEQIQDQLSTMKRSLKEVSKNKEAASKHQAVQILKLKRQLKHLRSKPSEQQLKHRILELNNKISTLQQQKTTLQDSFRSLLDDQQLRQNQLQQYAMEKRSLIETINIINGEGAIVAQTLANIQEENGVLRKQLEAENTTLKQTVLQQQNQIQELQNELHFKAQSQEAYHFTPYEEHSC